ncbi:hypothetical protein [Streptomyces cinnamoneus]|uniref:Uncharacterized protein n=1 Tax=Streptomyces cinnamoneus TaxID=53446 RepID=A0A918WNE6_STRCJ|nr:hypothetical protein [Streptomyces cinnamoneus]GHC63083.1 hypothetical protein GCM10010507_45400 [Streptomyces cinnamoneus]
MDDDTGADVLAEMEHDYITWLEQGGLSRMARLDGRDLTDPDVLDQAVRELALEPTRTLPAPSTPRVTLTSDSDLRWANLLAAFIEAVHSLPPDPCDARRPTEAYRPEGST